MEIKRADKRFLLFLILLGIGLSIVVYMPRTGSGTHLEIRINGQKTASYPLSSDRRETIACPDGGSNTYEIKNGAVYMREADCHDKICVGMHSISKPGETIVCLPHKLVLAVVTSDGKQLPGPDAVTGSANQHPSGIFDSHVPDALHTRTRITGKESAHEPC